MADNRGRTLLDGLIHVRLVDLWGQTSVADLRYAACGGAMIAPGALCRQAATLGEALALRDAGGDGLCPQCQELLPPPRLF